MTYEIVIDLIRGSLFLAKVNIVKYGTIVKKGETKVSVPLSTLPEGKTQDNVVREYIENAYLVDLRKNFYEEISELVLPVDAPVEVG